MADTALSGNVLLLTGIPGIGKTTVVKKILLSLSGINVDGFYTEEIREGNIRQGFELVTVKGKRIVMAHVDCDSRARVGKYGVDVAAIDIVTGMMVSREKKAEILIVDEIGKMECFSNLFRQNITRLLESRKPLIATVAVKGGGLISKVKNMEGVMLWEVTKHNREVLPGKAVAWILQRISR